MSEEKEVINPRLVRGYEIISNGNIPKLVGKETFIVPSQNGNGTYTVEHEEGWTCSCPDFIYRHVPCKHIFATIFWIKLRAKLIMDSMDTDADFLELQDELIEKELICPFCESINVVRDGKRITKVGERQRYLCKKCKRRFVVDPIKGRKATGKLIALCMDLFYKGLSYRKIADTMYQFYGLDLHHETVRRWVNKFTEMMNEYTKQFKPELGKKWQVDEQKVKANGEWVWCWNALDHDTRFLVANAVTLHRSNASAKKIFKKAKEVANGAPECVSTDGLTSYPKAIREILGDDVVHIKNIGIRDGGNNRVERFHSSWRERDKVMRGLGDTENTRQMLKNYRTYYNYLRKHQALNGKTPAEVAGIDLKLGKNKWYNLVKQSV